MRALKSTAYFDDGKSISTNQPAEISLGETSPASFCLAKALLIYFNTQSWTNIINTKIMANLSSSAVMQPYDNNGNVYYWSRSISDKQELCYLLVKLLPADEKMTFLTGIYVNDANITHANPSGETLIFLNKTEAIKSDAPTKEAADAVLSHVVTPEIV